MSVLNSMNYESLSNALPDQGEMNGNAKSWLQLYVDAMTEKDPYKRLALVEELRKIPRHDESDDLPAEPRRPVLRSKVVRRRH
jgi:hypothetical protein